MPKSHLNPCLIKPGARKEINMTKSIKVKPLLVWEGLVAIKKEATNKLMKTLSDVTLLDAEVKKIEISPADTKKDFEECEIFLNMHLQFYLKGVTSKQIDELMWTGSIKLLDRIEDERRLHIEYTTSYNFEFDEETGRVFEGSFSDCSIE